MPEVSTVPNTSSSVPKKPGINWVNILVGVIIGSLIVVFIGVGVLVFNAFQPKTTSEETSVTTSKTTTSSAKKETSSATPDETAGWKTYTSSALGFSIKHPSDWNFKAESIAKSNQENSTATFAYQTSKLQ